jgi:hypothetical protein
MKIIGSSTILAPIWVPFEVNPVNGRRLIDDYEISYLGAVRDVLRFAAASSG